MNNINSVISDFLSLTNTEDLSQARGYVEMADGDLGGAVELFFDNSGNSGTSDLNNQERGREGGERGDWGSAAPSSPTQPFSTSSWISGKRKVTQGRKGRGGRGEGELSDNIPAALPTFCETLIQESSLSSRSVSSPFAHNFKNPTASSVAYRSHIRNSPNGHGYGSSNSSSNNIGYVSNMFSVNNSHSVGYSSGHPKAFGCGSGNSNIIGIDDNRDGDAFSALFNSPDIGGVDRTFQETVRIAQQSGRWILVNIQQPDSFNSLRLNRDVWRSDTFKEVLASSFVFWQRDGNSGDGELFCSLYKVDTFPFIGVIDSRTTRLIKNWDLKKFTDEHAALSELMEFVDREQEKMELRAKDVRKWGDKETMKGDMIQEIEEEEIEEEEEGEKIYINGERRTKEEEKDKETVRIKEYSLRDGVEDEDEMTRESNDKDVDIEDVNRNWNESQNAVSSPLKRQKLNQLVPSSEPTTAEGGEMPGGDYTEANRILKLLNGERNRRKKA